MTTDEIYEAILDLHGAVSLFSKNTDERLKRLEGRFDNLEGRFDGLEGRFNRLEGRFDQLEGEMHRRFERVESTLVLHSAALNRIERRLDNHSDRITALESASP